MKVLVTGAKGFVGKNLCWALKNIQAGKDKAHPGLTIEAVYEYDLDSTPEVLDAWCQQADFVFNLAGVNRPQNQEEYNGTLCLDRVKPLLSQSLLGAEPSR